MNRWISLCLRYGWIFRWLGTAGLTFGALLLVIGVGVYSGKVDMGNTTYEVNSFRGLAATIIFPLFVIMVSSLVRELPSLAKRQWLWKNLSQTERNIVEAKFELEFGVKKWKV